MVAALPQSLDPAFYFANYLYGNEYFVRYVTKKFHHPRIGLPPPPFFH